MRIKFRTAASADMRRVARETKARWGVEQAAAYSAMLRDDIKSLREFPLRYPEFEARPGLRRMNSGKHAIFYLIGEERIDIVRVLHAALDFDGWPG